MRTKTLAIATLALAGLASCDRPSAPLIGAAETLVVATSTDVNGPRLTTGPTGRLSLSWMERRDDAAVLRFATLSERGFGAPRDVVNDPHMFVNWADLPSVMHVSGDHWIAHWLRYSADKTYSYDVVLAQSFDNGQSWSTPLTAHTDGTPTEHGFVSMYRADDGVGLLWLDGRATPDRPMTLRSAVFSPDNQRVHEQRIDDSVCDCCQTDIAISSRGPLAVYRDRTEQEIRDIYIARHSGDRWQPGQRLHADNWKIPGCPVNGPAIVADGDEVVVTWFSAANDRPVVRLIRSSDGGETFGEPLVLDQGSLSGYVGLVLLPAGHAGVSWVARKEDGGNRLLVAVVSPSNEILALQPVAEITQLRVFPQIGFQDGRLVLVWTDDVEDRRTLHAVRYDLTLP